METKKVAVVGAGLSGLIACKLLLSKGLTPIVFEAKDVIGGLWNDTIKSTLLQTRRQMFELSDFPWPKSVTEEYPRYDQVLDYLRSYAEHFGLFKYIRLNTKVLSIEYEGFSEEEIDSWTHWGGSGNAFSEQGKWKLNLVDARTNLPLQEEVVDFVVLCTGKFGDIPNIPKFPPGGGPKAFKNGKVLHYIEYAALDFDTATKHVKDKKIAIVGFQKSALELIRECTNLIGTTKPCTLIYKTEYWNPPDAQPWGIHIDYLFASRFAELLIHKPGEGFLLYLLAMLLAPIRWLITKLAEFHVRRKTKMDKYGMVPKHSILQDVTSCRYAVLPERFYERVEEGSIVLKKAPSFSFCEEGIMIQGETKPIHLDLVILATGYRGDLKYRNIFASSTFRDYMSFGDAALPLYRLCIHPRIPQVAVIGLTESISNLYTSEIRCRWLVEFLAGTFKLPSIKKMEKDIENWERCLKLYSGESYWRGCIGMLHHHYNDQVCKDIGWNPSPDPKLHLHRNKYIMCCGCFAALLLILAVIGIVLGFTVFHIKTPDIKIDSLSFPNDTLSSNSGIIVVASVSVRNPNVASFKYSKASIEIYYHDKVIGEGETPPGEVKAKDTLRMNVTVEIEPWKMDDASSLIKDWNSGSLSISSYTEIPGRVKILGSIKKNYLVKISCSLTYNSKSKTIQGQDCDQRVRISV